MRYKSTILIIALFFILIIPSVQANVFDDIKTIRKGINEVNKKLETMGNGIDDMNEKFKNVSESIGLIKDTNEGIDEMSEKLDELSNTLTEALDLKDKVDDYVDDIKLLITAGIITIIVAILTLIGATIVITKRRK